MKRAKILAILVLGLMALSGQTANGDVLLAVNGQPLDEITLKVGQACIIQVRSDDSSTYNAYVGFDSGQSLGIFSHLDTTPNAGDLGSATDYNTPAFQGYYISAAGTSPAPSMGIHFVFRYQAQEIGETEVKLYDDTLTSVIDSVYITVVNEEMGTAFTYNGQLTDSNTAADGDYDLRFDLYDSPSYGMRLGKAVDINDLDVIDGYFTVLLDYGHGVFTGDARWLEISVRDGDSNDPNDFVTLSPRQELTPTPYAIYAEETRRAISSSVTPAFSATNKGPGYAGSFEQTGPPNDNGGLEVVTASGKYGIRVDNEGGYNGSMSHGIYVDAENTDPNGKTSIGVLSSSNSTNGGTYGIYTTGVAGEGSTSTSRGVNSVAFHNGTSGDTYGVMAGSYGSDSGDSYGIYGFGYKYDAGYDGKAYGGYFIGENNRSDGESYGIYTKAIGSNGKRYGLYSEVTSPSEGHTNYGLYTKVTNDDHKAYGLYVDLDPDYSSTGVYVNTHSYQCTTDLFGVHSHINQNADTGRIFGIYSSVQHQGTDGDIFGFYSYTTGNETGDQYGIKVDAWSGTSNAVGDLYAVYARCDKYTSGNHSAGYFEINGGGDYAGYFIGNVHVGGTLTASTKSFVQPHKTDPSKEIVYASLEGPEHTVFIRGKDSCENGVAVIKMPEHWQQVAVEDDITVNLTPMGAWARLYVESASNKEVVVRVAEGGDENVSFCYHIMAGRDGFQEHQPVQKNKHFTAKNISASEFENRFSSDTLNNKAIRSMLQSNGILNADGKLNVSMAGSLGWKVKPDKKDPQDPGVQKPAYASD